MTQEQSVAQRVDALMPHMWFELGESVSEAEAVREVITALVTENDKLRAALAQHTGADGGAV